MLDLVLPLQCGGCGAPGTRWCQVCAVAMHLDADAPRLITPRIDAGVPVFALGRYAGPRRSAIVELKEHGRTDLVAPLARALALGIHRLLVWGIVDTPLTVVPAPTRRWAARRRGGDPVSKVAATATARHSGIAVVAALRTRAGTRDSVGLDIARRQRNVAGRVVFTNRPLQSGVLLVDDVVTTGSTAAESVRVLQAHGVAVTGVLAIAYA
jgi:predicted amidophosphoribosyltransferase